MSSATRSKKAIATQIKKTPLEMCGEKVLLKRMKRKSLTISKVQMLGVGLPMFGQQTTQQNPLKFGQNLSLKNLPKKISILLLIILPIMKSKKAMIKRTGLSQSQSLITQFSHRSLMNSLKKRRLKKT